MVEEAHLEAVDSGLTPVTDGWFVLNVRDAAWMTNEKFGARGVFEASGRVVKGRPDLEPRTFPDLGLMIDVIWPGQPSGLYHAETKQENFLVLAGECALLIEGEERHLRAWDFVHCPSETAHAFVGAGDDPCILLVVGARGPGITYRYPVCDAAIRLGIGVETETDSPDEAYVNAAPLVTERPSNWDELPWGRN